MDATAGAGWICPHCWTWVGLNQDHVCTLTVPNAYPYTYGPPLVPTWGPEWERLLAALERIAAALEARNAG